MNAYTCAYCRQNFSRREVDHDHVPPQGVFGKLWRRDKQLVTVWCCKSCHKGTSEDDDALKKLIGLGVIRTEEASNVMEEALRSIRLKSPLVRELRTAIAATRSTDAYSVDGVEIGHSFRYPEMMNAQVDRSIRRTVIGLIHKRHPDLDTRGYHAEISYFGDAQTERLRELLPKLPQLELQFRIGEWGFIAAWKWVGQSCVILLNFFGGVTFIVLLIHPADRPALEAGRAMAQEANGKDSHT